MRRYSAAASRAHRPALLRRLLLARPRAAPAREAQAAHLRANPDRQPTSKPFNAVKEAPLMRGFFLGQWPDERGPGRTREIQPARLALVGPARRVPSAARDQSAAPRLDRQPRPARRQACARYRLR